MKGFIGAGVSASVFAADDIQTGQTVAVKKYNTEAINYMTLEIKREI